MSLDPFETEKTRKPSGFSTDSGKSRQGSGQLSGYELSHQGSSKSRNCSGNSISQGLVCSGILNGGSNPVMIPGTNGGKISPPGMMNGGVVGMMQENGQEIVSCPDLMT